MDESTMIRSPDPAGGTSSPQPRILIIEDEAKTGDFLCKGLSEQGYEVALETDGENGLHRCMHERVDLLILDVGLPRRDGWSILRELRKLQNPVPVLFLTARDGILDRVQGLDLGADDYQVKPFAFAELLARVRMILRRNSARSSFALTVGDLTVDLSLQRVHRAGRRIELTQTELSLLVILIRHSPNPVPRKILAEEVWNMHFDSNTNVVDVTVKRLRSKVDDSFPQKLIQTIRGIGYACVPN
jgi:two-component system copper resistance phosphate regulon response regulator CusR